MAILNGRVRDVHPKNCTVDVQTEGGSYIESIPVMMPYFHQEAGEGIWALPEVGAHCVIITKTGEGKRPFVLGFLPLRESSGESGQVEEDHSAGRGISVPGDIILQGRDNNFVRLRRGGLVEIGASEGARSNYYPVGDLIQTICENYEMFMGGSYVKAKLEVDPESDGETDPMPFQIDIQVQEYGDKPPLIDMKFGHIIDDENRHLAGSPNGRVVARFLVFDQSTTELAEAAGIPPSADQAVAAIRFDRHGNAEQIYTGQYLLKAKGRRLYLTDSDVQHVQGNRTVEVTGNQDVHVGGSMTERVDGSRTISTRGALRLSCEQLILEQRRGGPTILDGNSERSIGGNCVDRIAGDAVKSSGGDTSDTTVGDRVVTTGGKEVHNVLHAKEPTSMFQNAMAYLMTVVDGAMRHQTLAGDMEFSIGPPTAPICKVKLHNNPLKPQEIGRLSIQWANPLQSLTVDGLTGTIEYKNAVGEFSMDFKGTTYIGPKAAKVAAGNVVTTMTHPVCYFTGMPILGCTSLLVGGPPGIPLAPGIPPIPMVPTTPSIDVPRP